MTSTNGRKEMKLEFNPDEQQTFMKAMVTSERYYTSVANDPEIPYEGQKAAREMKLKFIKLQEKMVHKQLGL
jgi:hypothetical protein